MSQRRLQRLPTVEQQKFRSTSVYSWSEIIPPQTALTFDWDPEDGVDDDLVAFSSTPLHLQSTHTQSITFPDSASQFLAADGLDRSSVPLTAMSNSNTTIFAIHDIQANHEWLFPPTAPTGLRGTQTSSTMGGKDVYARGSLLFLAHGNQNRYYSCLASDALDAAWEFDPRTDFEFAAEVWLQFWAEDGKLKEDRDDVTDEGYFSTTASYRRPLRRQDSQSTDCEDDEWSTLERPNTPTYFQVLGPARPALPRKWSNRLRKQRRPALQLAATEEAPTKLSLIGRALSCKSPVSNGPTDLDKELTSEPWVVVASVHRMRESRLLR